MTLLAKKERLILTSLLGLAVVGILGDVFFDLGEGAHWSHVAVELVTALFLGLGIGWLWLSQVATLKGEVLASRDQLQSVAIELDKFRAEVKPFKEGLNRVIDDQFAKWGLSPAERDIARLMLKGFSNREIAGIRESSELTIKQQAHAVFRKSSLQSRPQLLSYFLEDLF